MNDKLKVDDYILYSMNSFLTTSTEYVIGKVIKLNLSNCEAKHYNDTIGSVVHEVLYNDIIAYGIDIEPLEMIKKNYELHD